jgi:conjugative transfer signal peptidase TraF
MRSTPFLTRSGYAWQAFSRAAALAAPRVSRLSSSAKRAKGGLTVLLAGLLLANWAAPFARQLTLNLTSSMPRGLYVLSSPANLRTGDIVTFPVPATARAVVRERHYLPPQASLLKHVVALEGESVCLDGEHLVVNQRELAIIRRVDSQGRPLQPFPFCGTVPTGMVFVAADSPTSFDSRYFGPVSRTSLRLARPLWIY